MSRKLAVVLVVAALSVAFAVVSFLVHLARGRGPLLRAKLRLGALLLSLGAVAVTGACDDGGDVTCYAPSPQNAVVFEDPQEGPAGIPVDLAVSNVIRCRIEFRSGDLFSWRLADESLVERDRGDIEPLDGNWDESTEQFEVRIDQATPDGVYWFWIYDTDATHQPSDPYGFASAKLVVTNGGV